MAMTGGVPAGEREDEGERKGRRGGTNRGQWRGRCSAERRMQWGAVFWRCIWSIPTSDFLEKIVVLMIDLSIMIGCMEIGIFSGDVQRVAPCMMTVDDLCIARQYFCVS